MTQNGEEMMCHLLLLLLLLFEKDFCGVASKKAKTLKKFNLTHQFRLIWIYIESKENIEEKVQLNLLI